MNLENVKIFLVLLKHEYKRRWAGAQRTRVLVSKGKPGKKLLFLKKKNKYIFKVLTN